MERAPTGPAPAIPDPVSHGLPGTRHASLLPRRPQTSPLHRVLADHFTALERVPEEHFEPTNGPLRAAARAAVGRFLDCGLLEHGFARVRCGTSRAEFLQAFRCKRRHFCPSCHARRQRRWAELLRLVFRVDVEVCPRCGGEARIIGFVTEPRVVRRILAHLERRGVDARAGPSTGVAAAPGVTGVSVVGERGASRRGRDSRWGECAPGARGGGLRGRKGAAAGRGEGVASGAEGRVGLRRQNATWSASRPTRCRSA